MPTASSLRGPPIAIGGPRRLDPPYTLRVFRGLISGVPHGYPRNRNPSTDRRRADAAHANGTRSLANRCHGVRPFTRVAELLPPGRQVHGRRLSRPGRGALSPAFAGP